MKIYLVGGAVRDKLLGLPIKERDWVVVGATVQDMLKLGYKQVGKEFPVFLHPKTGEEYALARMERKVERGYKGFAFDTSPAVTLKEDLIRRDLTINAMAETEAEGLVDPYHGRADLEKKMLRHVSPAFAEDPVRILRLGRFLARYHHLGFQVAPETMDLMRKMVVAGEVDALVAERVWKELERALAEKNPEKFFELLDECGALQKLFPELDIHGDGMSALIASTILTPDTTVRFAAFLHNLQKSAIAALCKRLRVPTAYKELAEITVEQHKIAFCEQAPTAEQLITFFYAVDVVRKSDRFEQFLLVCKAIAQSHDPILVALRDYAQRFSSVDVTEFIDAGLSGAEIGAKIREKRFTEIEKLLKEGKKDKK